MKQEMFTLQALLAHGANIEARDGYGTISLSLAPYYGNLDVVKVSLESTVCHPALSKSELFRLLGAEILQ